MFIDDNGYIEYSLKEVQERYMPTRAELVTDERPFYNRYLNNRKKKHGRNQRY